VLHKPRLFVGAAVKLYLAIKAKETSGNNASFYEVFLTIALKMK
jgi:hypothetical protein